MVRKKIVSDNKKGERGFTSGTVVRTLSSQQGGHIFHPYSKNQDLRSHAAWLEKERKQKKKKEQKEEEREGKKKRNKGDVKRVKKAFCPPLPSYLC